MTVPAFDSELRESLEIVLGTTPPEPDYEPFSFFGNDPDPGVTAGTYAISASIDDGIGFGPLLSRFVTFEKCT